MTIDNSNQHFLASIIKELSYNQYSLFLFSIRKNQSNVILLWKKDLHFIYLDNVLLTVLVVVVVVRQNWWRIARDLKSFQVLFCGFYVV